VAVTDTVAPTRQKSCRPAPERETVRERERESERETGRVAVTDTVAPTRQKSCRPHRICIEVSGAAVRQLAVFQSRPVSRLRYTQLGVWARPLTRTSARVGSRVGSRVGVELGRVGI
jgi:hypothetical protein